MVPDAQAGAPCVLCRLQGFGLNPNMRSSGSRIRRVTFGAAWISLLLIAYATLSRAGLVYSLYETLSPLVGHPSMRTYAHFEHIVAFMIMGFLFSLAYPRQTFLVCLFVFAAAASLEVLQTLTPDRHGTLADCLEKAAGGAAGVALGRSMAPMCRLRRKHRTPKVD